MNDTQTTVAQIKDIVKKMVDEREWNQFHSPKNLAMFISVEANELMEHFLYVDNKESYEKVNTHRQEIENELADTLIVAIAFANACNIDIAAAVAHKIEEIKKKYPIDKAYGKSLKYNQL
jgi:dCTP diphosphatase